MNMSVDILIIGFGGVLAGLVGSLMGLGGGIIAVPFLNLVLSIPMHVAAASGLISTLSVSCGAAGRYLRRGNLVDVPTAFNLEFFAAAGGLLGGIVVGWLRGPILQIIFAVTLVYGAIHILRTARRKEENPKTALGLEVAGSLTTGGVAGGGKVVAAKTLPAAIKTGAAVSGAVGTVAG